jgi:23S rRNA (adenine2503-C2)-methyltransferase
MMRIVQAVGDDRIARVYIAEIDGHRIEFAESVPPPFRRDQKWVLILSCMIGCPVRCRMCDAGRECHGLLSAEQMLAQIDYLVSGRFPDRCVSSRKFKVQFTRMGEPTFNPAVLEVLEALPRPLPGTAGGD